MAVFVAAIESGHFRIGTQRACLAGERPAGSDHAVRRPSLFDPLLDCRKHVEPVRRLSAAAVGHAGDKEQAGPGLGALVVARRQLFIPLG